MLACGERLMFWCVGVVLHIGVCSFCIFFELFVVLSVLELVYPVGHLPLFVVAPLLALALFVPSVSVQ